MRALLERGGVACPRCHQQVLLLVEGSDLCLSCDSLIDHLPIGATMTATLPAAAKADILTRLAAAVDSNTVPVTTNELANEYGLMTSEVGDIAKKHGWPRPESMRRAAMVLRNPATPRPQTPAAAPRTSAAATPPPVAAAEAPTPAPAPKPEPYIAALAVNDLFADPAYQRDLDNLRVQRMATDFRIALVGIIEVSKRPDGRYAILDGQHRWATVRDCAFGSSDENPHLACRVHDGLTVAEEAALYHQLNTTRKQLTGWDRWLARRGAGDTEVLAIEECAARHGLTIGMQAGGTILRATKACENVVTLGGIPLLDQVLDVVRAAYPDDQAGLDGNILHGLGHVLDNYSRDELDMARLVSTLSGVMPRQVTARASSIREVHKGTMDRLTAHVIVERYNAVKGPRLQAFFERVKPGAKTRTVTVKGADRERAAMLEWAKRTGFQGRTDRVTPTLRKAYQAAHQERAS